ncbi:MAG: Capsular polysaccharide ABC transporter, permease protein KpsM [uncultured Sulfurovum sp.]|uniref:Transport permease protein n=1 Tax=uncultured Sulfurovum sp. TaxID=269237 RepID=A0A6S6TZN2_9BACT|nr:MAG: Capsular polysaccharide ABC transporter, permease protein KpsM [uncultured Sulfurovum sp.]
MKKRSAFKIFLAVQNALFLRELAMRFSSGRMGLFWTFFEPFFQIMVFVVIKILFFSTGENNFDFAVFLALNFTAFNMFKHIVMKSVKAFKANKALFIYKQVKPIDTIIARTLVEVFITAIIIVIFLFLGFYFEYDMEVKDLTMVTFGFIYFIIFSFSFALLLAVLNTFIESIGKLVGFLLTALMFASAVFYNLAFLPLEIQSILLYNPVTHFMEMIHGSYFYGLDDSLVSYGYIFFWTLSLLFIGLWLYVKLEKRILTV